MKNQTQWQEALQLSEHPSVAECLQAFSDDSTEDNAVCLVRAVLDSAAPVDTAAIRSAALEEASKVCQAGAANHASETRENEADDCAEAIRALKDQSSPAEKREEVANSQQSLEHAALAQRILEWLGKNGKENTGSLLLYEAMKALKAKPASTAGEVKP